MQTYEFIKRRARPGCGQQKKELMAEHKMLRAMVDHHTIMCYDREPSPELLKARSDKERIENLLLEITS
ncbi:hypothetical protein PHG31p244 [Aeromonas phage 31]|uniref:Uncharacterized protein n=4 Tax=Biquartavirus TaxID=1912143 RepID=Q6U953_9CAUD|nr:hypothetical protein ST44RRORF249c [Aeromonas phage 44RR2.8t]YP_238973.1 hypothetical protein PHG31p244 [Aeromonas phage 31]APU00722.1 hypothetical protein [Aeromonas phage 44RR2.8t.2]APU01137.1 hypothetical protein [Aeromonas phage 31.2]APU02049.1 hypothetical protein [Aeromonas phage L9-6]APU02298.1 hypothetical protein [Aeromonas phage Riv-10]APU02547.1 hypothetical protein [Aeromonas phage SW69-9]UYD59557.1 hypothetical protein JNMOADIG_00028 [Aeromonas phage avDM5]UYD60469.1 hypothe